MEIITWCKAKASNAQGNCVEVGTSTAGSVAGIRDSKSPERGHLAVTPDTFRALLTRIKSGELGSLGTTRPTPGYLFVAGGRVTAA
jgi:hypothetical protein